MGRYVVSTEMAKEFLDKLMDLLDSLLPRYIAEGKSGLVIGIGCTGGRHRSVAIAEWLAKKYRGKKYGLNVFTRHRDLSKA